MSEPIAYDIVTDRILERLEEGTVPWRRPWTESGLPRSVRGHVYRGVNVFMLSLTDYASPFWTTFKMAAEAGAKIKKGEHGTPVVFWKVLNKPSAKDPAVMAHIPMLQWYRVWNVEQTEGGTWPKRVTAAQDRIAPNPIATAEAIAAGWDGAPPTKWGAGMGQAYYSPLDDEIRMPARSSFTSPEGVYDTWLHELVHSTGHPSRLNRFEPGRFGSHAYGREELVAEMGDALLCAQAGILPATIENHAAYCASWIKTIKEDKRALVVAAGAAQRAVDMILGRVVEHSEEQAA